MLPRRLTSGLDKRRLRNFIALFFLALAAPTAALIWQAYSQLKWEAFHQYRGVAEELTNRIDTRLNDMIRTADARSFADYRFLVVSGNVSGDTSTNASASFVQRSPLSAYPVAEDLPGVLGYFQVDTDGAFSTPILPPEGTAAASLGIGENEYANRLQLAREIQAVLADNRLVQSRPHIGGRRDLALNAEALNVVPEEEPEEKELEENELAGSERGLFRARRPDSQLEEITAASEGYDQKIFDQLNQSEKDTQDVSFNAAATPFDDESSEATELRGRLNSIAKVSDLKLDADLQRKSEQVEREAPREQAGAGGLADTSGRSKRREQIALPESVQLADSEPITNLSGTSDLRISTFESEIDPFEFSLLDSGHIVLFRKVWRDGERYIQGLLLDQEAFIQDIIGASFIETSLSGMSNLIVAYEDDVIRSFSGRANASYPNGNEALDGTLLYRGRLTAPLNSLELIFSINRLPPGAGASVLAWVTLVLAMVFAGGFAVLYRLGLSQINLARQQQDFVSAVSHELKTPLTSIRMYGEMLKEGWADEEKRQTYYEFIHDESERLSKLISNVLQLARITRNDPQFDMKRIEVGALMSNTQSKFANQIERAGFELRLTRDDDADRATIDIDEDCFAQIIINLVDNAIKFSKEAEKKVIEVGSRLTRDRQVLFSVRDYGPGIPRDQMKKIFELFYRSESELTRETVGTGIGLSIVHQLTLAMNGSVDLVNAEPGAEFQIRFPQIAASY